MEQTTSNNEKYEINSYNDGSVVNRKSESMCFTCTPFAVQNCVFSDFSLYPSFHPEKTCRCVGIYCPYRCVVDCTPAVFDEEGLER